MGARREITSQTMLMFKSYRKKTWLHMLRLTNKCSKSVDLWRLCTARHPALFSSPVVIPLCGCRRGVLTTRPIFNAPCQNKAAASVQLV